MPCPHCGAPVTAPYPCPSCGQPATAQEPYEQPPAAPGYGPPPAGPGYGQPTPGYGYPAYGPPTVGPSYGYPAYGGAAHAYPVAPGELASAGIRLLARIIDLLAAGLLGLVLAFLVGGAILGAGSPSDEEAAAISGLIGAILAFVVVVSLFGAVNEIVGTAISGRTLGKKIVGIRVVREDGSAAGWGGSLLRFAAQMGVQVVATALGAVFPLFGLVGWIDPLWLLWDERKQALHDKAAHTVVIRG